MAGRADYEERVEGRKERLERAAEKNRSEADALFHRVDRMAGAMNGQPILIGHHSEKRHRRDLARMDRDMGRGVSLVSKAKDQARRAEGVGKHGISSDDPLATVKLKERIAGLEAKRALYKAVNKAHRAYKKNPAILDRVELPEEEKKLIQAYVPAWSWEPNPYAPYQLTNLGANIRRLQRRLKALETEEADPGLEARESGAVRLWEDREINRVCFSFPKDDLETRKAVKSRGWHWNRTEGCWTRLANTAARRAAEVIFRYLENS